MCDYRGSVHASISLCERLEKGESTPNAAALIRQQAHEIDDLWDRLSRAYALVRRESPGGMIQEEMEQLRAMLDARQHSQLKKTG
jgi:ribosomal protein L16 Arg81 hydroxylase